MLYAGGVYDGMETVNDQRKSGIERRETEKRSRDTDRKREWFSFRAFLFSENSQLISE